RLNTAIGYWGAFTGIATFAGLAGSAVMLQAATWRLLWWVMTAVTAVPVPLVAAMLTPDQPRSAGSTAAAAQRIGAPRRSPRPCIAGLAFACYTIGLMQHLLNAGNVAGPPIVAWLVTRTGGWQSTWWMSCSFAGVGGLLSRYLSEPRLGITFRPPRPVDESPTVPTRRSTQTL